jgi:type IV pilus assembly protein PilE
MERYASANGSYPLPQNIPSSVVAAPDVSYQLKVTSSSDSFTLMAIPTGNQLDDPCSSLTLSHTGVRDVKNASISANDCWQR